MDRRKALAIIAEQWDHHVGADTRAEIAGVFGVFPDQPDFWNAAGIIPPLEHEPCETAAFACALSVELFGKSVAAKIASNPSCIEVKRDVLDALQAVPRYVYDHEDVLVIVQGLAGHWFIGYGHGFDKLPAPERVAIAAIAAFRGHVASDRMKAGELRLADAHVASAFERAMRDVNMMELDGEDDSE